MKQALPVFVSVFILLFATSAQGQYITTFAGTPDNTGYSGDGSAATAALLYSPSDVTFDVAGNLYIADFYNNVIRTIDTFGIIHTIAGTGYGSGTMAGGDFSGDGGPATAARLNGPFGLAIDAGGNVIFADGYNHVVRKITPAGIITTIAGDHTTAAYTGDGGPATAGQLNNPVGIAIDRHGNIYIADDHNNAVRKIDTAGILTTFAGNHSAGYSGDGGQATAASLSDPIGVGVDTAGNVFIADADNNVIRKVSTTGIITTFAGNNTAGYTGDGGPATAATLRSPERVNFDAANNLYISDFFNNVVRMVDASGTITTFAGIGTGAGSGGTTGAYSGDDGPATAAELFDPQGVAIDRYGKAFICDRGNETIRMVGPQAPVVIDHTGVGSLQNHNDGALKIYPDPATDGAFSIYLASGLIEPVEVSITNVLGEAVKKTHCRTNQALDIKLNVPPGVYYVTASTGHEKFSGRVVVE